MTREDFRTKRYQLSVIAGMNQRYHQTKSHQYWKRDFYAKVITAVLATISLGLAIASPLARNLMVDVGAIVVALAAALAAIVLNVLPFGAKEREHVDAFRRWTDLREEVDCLEYDMRDSDPSADLVQRLRQLDAKNQRICGSETLADTALLDQCQAAEERSRGCTPGNSPAVAA